MKVITRAAPCIGRVPFRIIQMTRLLEFKCAITVATVLLLLGLTAVVTVAAMETSTGTLPRIWNNLGYIVEAVYSQTILSTIVAAIDLNQSWISADFLSAGNSWSGNASPAWRQLWSEAMSQLQQILGWQQLFRW